MSQPAPRRPRRLRAREPRPPSEREWERSALLEPRLAPRQPEMVSDGGGLPFPPGALYDPPQPLQREDGAVAALVAYLASRSGVKPASRAPWRRNTTRAPAEVNLDGWRQLARSDSEVLFARGRAPELLTVAIRQEGRRRAWTYVGSSAARPLRATRDGIRASSWRLDPTHAPRPDDMLLRVLVTERTFSGGQRADGRVLAPDLCVEEAELVLTMFVTPRPGYQAGSRNPETPVRVALPEALGQRRVTDGGLAALSPPGPGAEPRLNQEAGKQRPEDPG